MTRFSRNDTLRIRGSALASLAFSGLHGPSDDLSWLFLPSCDPKACTYFPKPPFSAWDENDNPDAFELAVQLVDKSLLSATPTAREKLARRKVDQNGRI